MKAILILASLILMCACQSKTSENIFGIEKSVKIIDKHKYLETHIKTHHDMDVVVYKVDPNSQTHMNYGYAIVIYQDQKNKKNHRFDFMVASKDNYDVALYKWENDTILRMKLYSSIDNLSSEVTQILRNNGGEIRSEPYN